MKINKVAFLKDVLICSLGAFGGPEAHYGVFNHQLVDRKNYLSEEELLEYMALTSVLPGPSSTQTIVAIGVKHGGPFLGFLTLLVWALPIVIALMFLALGLRFFDLTESLTPFIQSLGYIAIAFILYAGIKMALKTFKTPLRITLSLIALGLTFFYRLSWVFPLILILGGLIHAFLVKIEIKETKVAPVFKWTYLNGFLILAVVTFFGLQSDSLLIYLFSQFYQFGYLVIGGGQVVIPYMVETLVNIQELISLSDFLGGLGLVQGLPGPMFSFASYAGGLAAFDQSFLMQGVSSILSAVGLFLPGILLLYFVYPLFSSIKSYGFVRSALLGITSVATGLVLSTALTLFIETPFEIIGSLIILITLSLLFSKKMPAPFIVLCVTILGSLFI